MHTAKTTIGSTDGFGVTVEVTGNVIDMPEPEWLTLYIVSRVVATQLMDRTDVLVPGDFIRDEAGNIVGCNGFSTIRKTLNFRKENKND